MHSIPPRPTDTTREAEGIQIDLLRAAPVSRRLYLACSLSASVISLAQRAQARANPQAEATECGIRFIELHYGSALAAAVRAELTRRQIPDAPIAR